MGQRICCICFLLLSSNLLPAQQLGKDWGEATAHAGWVAFPQAMVFNDKMWVFAWPAFPGPPGSEVWYSSDGAGWTTATVTPSWPYRDGHASVAFGGKIWIVGGQHETSCLNDVWYSSDGVTWTSATLSAPWSPRVEHTSVVFDGKMWVIGGWQNGDPPSAKNDVWYSSDGATWTSATLSAPWAARSGHTAVVFDGKIWVIGGVTLTNYKNDVWYSSDGVNWTSATLSASWAPRYGHSSVVHDGKVWLIGGHILDHPWNNDVWYSSDGVHWTSATLGASWPARGGQTAVVYDNKIWIMGGSNGWSPWYESLNDVWYSPGFYSVGVPTWRLYP